MKSKLLHYMQKRREEMENREDELLRRLYYNDTQKYPIPSIKPFIMAWLLVLTFPMMFFRPSPDYTLTFGDIVLYYFPILTAGFIFTLNQFILVPRIFFRRQYGRYFVWNMALLFLCAFVRELVFFLVEREAGQGVGYFFGSYCFMVARDSGILRNIIGLIMLLVAVSIVCLMCIVFSMSMRKTMLAFVTRDREQAQLRYELDFLKNQLSPHFLFNTLNNITALIQIDPGRAEKSMTKLSKLLRVMLYQTGDEKISLKEDVEILEKYADLEKLRLDPEFDFKMEVDIQDPERKIEPLLAMPLMENALKHSLSAEGKGFAHIRIVQKDDEFIFYSENSNHPRVSKPKAGGLGLSTFSKRLEMLYASRFQYETHVEGDKYCCSLKIELTDE